MITNYRIFCGLGIIINSYTQKIIVGKRLTNKQKALEYEGDFAISISNPHYTKTTTLITEMEYQFKNIMMMG